MAEHDERPDDLLTAKQAVEYLRRRWSLPSYNVNAFRQHRHRHSIKPVNAPAMENASLWKRSELDAIPAPNQTKQRKPEPPKQAKRRANGSTPKADASTKSIDSDAYHMVS